MNYKIINERKKVLGYTNIDLSEKTGITRSTLDKITSGKNQNPTLDTLQAIADVIGCTIDDFRDLKQNNFSNKSLQVAAKYESLDEIGCEIIDQVMAFAIKYHSKPQP